MRALDWPEKLSDAIEAARARPFKWGEHDCCLFAANVVQSIADVDYAASFRGKYDSEIGAARLIAPYGSLETMIDSILDEKVHPAFAQRGDVVLGAIGLNDGAQVDALGICIGVYSVLAGPEGLSFSRTSGARVAWKIR